MDGDFSLGGVIYCIEKELKSGSSISSFIPSAVTDTQRTPGQLTWAQPFTAPFICLSPIEEPSAGDRDAEHLRPPRLPRPPARAARAPREARTPDGRLDALLPGPHHGQRATRSSLPIRTSAAPRKRGPDTSGRGAPRGARSISSDAAEPRPGPPCSRARWREATNAPLRPPRLPRGAQRRPAALGTGKAVRRRRPRPPRTRHGEPAPPGAGQGRAAPRPAGPLGRPREVTPPLTTPPPPPGRPRPRRRTPARPSPEGSQPLPPPGDPRPRPEAVPDPAGSGPGTHGRGESRGRAASPRPTGAARGKVTDPRSPPGSIKRRGPAHRRHGNKRVSLPPASGGSGGAGRGAGPRPRRRRAYRGPSCSSPIEDAARRDPPSPAARGALSRDRRSAGGEGVGGDRRLRRREGRGAVGANK